MLDPRRLRTEPDAVKAGLARRHIDLSGIDRAIALGLPYVSLIWHPWSLNRFDPEMRMLKLTFAYVRELGLETTTYEAEWQRVRALEVASA